MKKSSSLIVALSLGTVLATSALAQQPAPRTGGPTPAGTPPPPAPPVSPTPVTAATPAPPVAAVAPPAAPSLAESLSGTAKADYDAAKLLFGVGDFGAALIKFSSAHDASHDPRLLWDVATCEGKLHHYAKAVGLLRVYLKEGGGLLSDQDRSDADQTIKAMEPLTSTMRVSVNEPGASVYLDEQLVGQTPLEPLLVDIGVHTLRVQKDGFEGSAQEVTVSGGAQLSMDFHVRPIVHEGHVSVHAGPNDAIAVDGRPVGVGAWTGALTSGGHTVRVTAEGMLAYQSEVLVQDGQSRDIGVSLDPEPRKGLLPAWAWVAGGVVLAGGLGTGAYFLFKPTSQYTGPAGNLGPGLVQASAPIHLGHLESWSRAR